MKNSIKTTKVPAQRLSAPILLAASCLIGSQSPGVLAQGAGALEVVVVTARKRAESMQDTPVAITSFSAEGMRADGILNVTDLVKFVPGVSNKDGAKYSGLAIRGVGSRIYGERSDPGVGVYVDGIFMPRSDTQLIDIVDVESVQVLRGPQGTLFGKNTAGGAMLLTTVKPTEEFGGFADVNLGDYDRQYVRGGVNGPLVGDTLMGSLVVQSRKEDGYMDDAVTGYDYGNIDRKAVVGQLRWVPIDELTVDLLAMWSKQHELTAPTTCRNIDESTRAQTLTYPGASGTFGEACSASAALEDDDKVTLDAIKPVWENTTTLVGLTADWEFAENLSLRSISGYLKQDDTSHNFDADATNLVTFANREPILPNFAHSGIDVPDQKMEFFSQEFDFIGSALDDRLNYTVGVFGSVEKMDHFLDGNIITPSGWVGFPLPTGSVFVPSPNTAGFNRISVSDFKNESAALFSQLIYSLTDDVQLTVGARYTWEKKTVDAVNYASASQSPGLVSRATFDALANTFQDVIVDPVTPGFNASESWTDTTPMASLAWTLPDSVLADSPVNQAMLYVSYAEGFKAGGFSPFFTELLAFEPENLTSYEFGFKLDMLDNRMRLNGAVYTSTYDDLQLNVNRQSTTTGALLPLTAVGVANAGDADLWGAELELSVLPIDGLYIGLTGGYINAEYNEFNDFSVVNGEKITIDRADEDFAFIPKQTYSLQVKYDWQTSIGTITPQISGFYKDSVFFGLDSKASQFSGAYLDSYYLWNARLAFQPAAMENLTVTAYTNNLADENYYGSATGDATTQGAASLNVGQPRTYGIEVYYRW